MNILLQKDITRMLSSVENFDENCKQDISTHQRRDELKKLSNEHVSKWTDTIESQRQAKLRWKKEVQEEAEEERKRIDAEEYKRKEKVRNELIKRAKDLQYEQKEKPRFLRSQQLYTDVIATREQQILEKVQSKAKLVEEEKQWHQRTMQIVNEAEERENMDALIRAKKEKNIGKAMLKHILEKEITMKRKNEQQKKDEEDAIRKIAIKDIEEEKKQFQEKIAVKRKTKEEMDKLNKEMKNSHKARLLKEKQEAIEREETLAAMTLLANKRAQLEKIHIERRQLGRKFRSDQAAREFNAKATKEIELFAKEQKKQESKAREQQELDARKAEETTLKIHQSRQEQIKLKHAKKMEEIKEQRTFTDLCERKNQHEQQKKREEEHNRRQRNIDIRGFQEKQISERQKQCTLERELKLEEEEKEAKELKREDDLFQEFALKEIEKFRVQEKKTNLLEKYMETGGKAQLF